MFNTFKYNEPSCPLTEESVNRIVEHNPQIEPEILDILRRVGRVLKPDLAVILANTPELTEEEKEWLVSTALNVVERDERPLSPRLKM